MINSVIFALDINIVQGIKLVWWTKTYCNISPEMVRKVQMRIFGLSHSHTLRLTDIIVSKTTRSGVIDRWIFPIETG